MSHVRLAQTLGQQHLQPLPDHLVALVPKQLLGLIVHHLDRALVINRDNRLRR
jgi:hypothetical protein